MAGCDYYTCDNWHCKALYDANIYWEEHDVGEVKIICKACAETHSVIVVKKSLLKHIEELEKKEKENE